MSTLRVEFHCHTIFSKDSLTKPEQLVNAARKKGLQRVIVTDHNSIGGALRAQKIAPELVIVGEEIMTTRGEILAAFVTEEIPARLTPRETIKRLRDQGAVISVAHPYDRLRKGAWEEPELLKIVDDVDALEVFNARCLYAEDNATALAFAESHGKLATVGSDGHITYEYGHATLHMQPFEGAGDFFEALKTATRETSSSPFWVHLFSSYAKFLRKRGLSHMPV